MLSSSDLLNRWPALDLASRVARLRGTVGVKAGPLASTVAQLEALAVRALARLWNRDAALWTSDSTAQQQIAHRLGWLDAPALMADSQDRLGRFADKARHDGFTHAVLLGMGGSSLAPEVLRSILGANAGWLQLHVLDSTDPAAIVAVDTPAERTLIIIASKSGTTIEPVSLAAAFQARLISAGVQRWADHMVAITDEGTELAVRGATDGFREVFINPSDIGGRYSALSFFGLVPSSLMGHDIAAVIGWGLAELMGSAPEPGPASAGSGVALGTIMAAGARSGRDKLTLLMPPALEPFGLWVEQLVAESTGKRGTGIVPIAGESPADASRYGADRLFVRMRLASDAPIVHDRLVSDLIGAGHPVVDISVPEAAALGAEFVRWEIATVLASALLEVNPFDEPNVAQAKAATGQLLREFKTTGRLPHPPPDRVTASGVGLRVSQAVRAHRASDDPTAILRQLKSGDYFALLAYLGPAADLARELHALRMTVRDMTGAATMFGYGPRYLHSTGQLHKGGANSGVFVLISSAPRTDVPIPGEGWSFGTLELAQALGDFASLDAEGRRALHVHLPQPDPQLIASVGAALLEHLRPDAPDC